MTQGRLRYCATVPMHDPDVELRRPMKWGTLSGKLHLSAVQELFPEYVWEGRSSGVVGGTTPSRSDNGDTKVTRIE